MSEHQSDQEFAENLIKFNQVALLHLLPNWCCNVADNLEIARELPNLPERPFKKHDKCVVVAGAPGLTDEEILQLKHAKVDIIITNKNLKRFVELGVRPTYVCILDANAISKPQFEILETMDNPGQLRFYASMTCYPGTLKRMFEHSIVYAFNPTVDFGGNVSISKTWEWMNFKDETPHGGNVGTLAFDLAKRVGYKQIGLLGWGLCEVVPKGYKPVLKEEGVFEDLPTEFLDYDDVEGRVALPVHFKVYLMYLIHSVQEVDEGVTVTNLSKSPVLRHSPILMQSSLEDFLKVI